MLENDPLFPLKGGGSEWPTPYSRVISFVITHEVNKNTIKRLDNSFMPIMHNENICGANIQNTRSTWTLQNWVP